MNKKIVISIVIAFITVVIGFGIWRFNLRNNSVTENNNSTSNEIINNVDLSMDVINDDCINEWNDYAETIQEEIKSASSELMDENTRYLVKDVNGYIYIYYLDDSNEETLYRKTEISTEYLSAQDLDDLEIGIEVKGAKELNQLIENYE